MQQTSQRVLKLSGALLALLVLLTFNVGTTHAAAPCAIGAPLGTGTPLDAGTPCDMTFAIQSNPGPLTYTADANLTIASGTHSSTIAGSGIDGYTYTYNGFDDAFPISFDTTVSDHRGGDAGWNLSASATIIPSGDATITLGTSTATTIGTNITGCTSTCSPAFTDLGHPTAAVTLVSDPSKPFIGAPTISSGGPTNVGDYAITTPGTLTIPSTVLSGTAISGTITLTLNDAAAIFV